MLDVRTSANYTASPIWFQDILTQSLLKKNDFIIFEQVINKSIDSLKFNPENKYIQDNSPRIIAFTIGDDKSPARVFYGCAIGILEATKQAFEQMISFYDIKNDKYIIKVDIVTSARKLPDCTEKSRFDIDWGTEGIAFSQEFDLILWPEQIAYNFLLDDNRELYVNRTYNFLENEPAETTKFFRLLRSKKFDAYIFSTEGFWCKKEGLEYLYRGQRVYEKITRANIENSIRLAAGYLERAVLPSGRFDYLYYADANRSMKDYSALRHAGTAFSMAEYLCDYKDEKVLGSLNRAMAYMMKFLAPGVEDPSTLCMLERGTVKLGGNGLTMLAVAKYIEATGDRSYDELLRKLADWVMTQVKEDGSFHGHIQYYPDGNYRDSVSDYYPGEVIYGLMLSHKLMPNNKWLEACTKIAKWLIEVRDKGKAVNDLQHDHWLLYGFNELHRYAPDPMYLEHTAKIVQSIINKQNINVKHIDHHGSFYSGDPRSTPAATRSEGMLAAYKLLSDFTPEKKEFLESMLLCITRTISFQLRTQYNQLNSIYLSYRDKAFGGFRGSLNEHDIRIDYVQHSLSSLLLYKKVMKDVMDTQMM